MANEIVRIAGRNFYTDELYHWGRAGMKWHMHIFGKKSGSSKKKTANKKARTLDDDIKAMSDDELKSAAARLQNEVNYKTNYEKLHPVQVSKGKKFVGDVKSNLYSAAMEASKQVATDFIKKQLSNALNKAASSNSK